MALVTLPALRQRVQTYTRRGAAPTKIRTFWRFGSKRRLVARIEWLRLCPKAGPRPQLWQTFDIRPPSLAECARGPSPGRGGVAGHRVRAARARADPTRGRCDLVTMVGSCVTTRWLG